MRSFVEDLLDLRQIRDGVFSLKQAPFNPKDVLSFVCKSFKPQADFKNVRLYAKICSELKPPNEVTPWENESFGNEEDESVLEMEK